MKFSTVFTAAAVAVLCLLQPSAAEEQASVHLRVHTVEQSPNGAICYLDCPTGQYCPRGENKCRAPTGNQCFNPATSLFREGCDPGFKCDKGNNMKFSTVFTAAFVATACLFQSTTAEDQAAVHLRVHTVEQNANGAICYQACASGQYCPRGETACRAPTGSQCFNPATSLFIDACDPGFKCDNGKCVYA
ncbi:hypothetical protein L917_03607 [Phytophthora nicotianae]|uniref:Cysteine-rich protein n=1 Tax=Phytophthora nicotianae TaxID=4792 RepID=W2LSD1_PHYNI|nr:hypothetical protein L917_03607 [Phytophthora nicotianae]